jgi:4-amino-4-deoxychorismate lyase
MIGRKFVNGVEGGSVSVDDRGLQYGDGLFETMGATDGRVRRFRQHMTRLADGCRRLGMPAPPVDQIENDCLRAIEGFGSAVVKLTLTRGPGPRGYPPPAEPSLTRIVVSTAQQVSEAEAARMLTLRVCETRLGRNPLLSGMKHLNRLEQVLAGAELRDTGADEGLMLSTDDRIVCATAANVFLVRAGELLTPEIADCGVAGVMRDAVLRSAEMLGLPVDVGNYTLDDLARADECFLTNAVRGVRPVGRIAGVNNFKLGELTARLREATEAADE